MTCRLLVTVQKHMTVAEMKGIMLGVLGREEQLLHDRVVMCEVVDRSITRVLVSYSLSVDMQWYHPLTHPHTG